MTAKSIRVLKLVVGAFQAPLLVFLVLAGLEIKKIQDEKVSFQSYRQQEHLPKEIEKKITSLNFRFGLLITITSVLALEIIFTLIALISNSFGFLLTSSLFNLLIPGCYVGHIQIFKAEVYLAESITGAIFSCLSLVPIYLWLKLLAAQRRQAMSSTMTS